MAGPRRTFLAGPVGIADAPALGEAVGGLLESFGERDARRKNELRRPTHLLTHQQPIEAPTFKMKPDLVLTRQPGELLTRHWFLSSKSHSEVIANGVHPGRRCETRRLLELLT